MPHIPGHQPLATEFLREQALAGFAARPMGLQTVVSPSGQTFFQAPGGALIPTAPTFADLFDVSEEEAAAEAAPILREIEAQQRALEPVVARRGTLDPLSRGFGATGGQAQAGAERGVAGLQAEFIGQRGNILEQATRDILTEREGRERQRQGLLGIAMRQVGERERGARFDLGLTLEGLGREEDVQLAREESFGRRAFENQQLANQIKEANARRFAEEQARKSDGFDPFFFLK